MTPEVSVVIVSYNSAAHLPACLTSLREHTTGVTYDVTIVDNASNDGTAAMLAREFPWVRVIARKTNIGLSAGVNEGVAASSGRFVAPINPDVRFDADALAVLAAYLREHADVGIVAPKLLDPDGTLQLSCRAFPGYSTAFFNRYSLLTRLLPRNRFSRDYLMANFDHASIADVDWLSGAAMMSPRDVFEKIGGWDPRFFVFSEDVDYCKRVHDAGYRVVYNPDAVLYHTIGVSKHAGPRIIIERHKSMWRYYRKHLRGHPGRDAVTAAGIAGRCTLMIASSLARGALARVHHSPRTSKA